ncbi:UTP--glucose-1-phosphate uridylyltransferase GalU [Salinibacillus xinjiangensis]|uniref:UTP--glucose-1-phosphate uridylyltransferase n=1 Tax=Salinibacillus xinjiangensis TaxID=1229268 RepID=A0A6G1X271_9BACI|nr:UTP--glucose-1-phosphate uridylyltransferase GalU [Salinibacillus xinjiangensis]MRG85083.1 UTP--glucose-1-phosphate uridylyltransferase GalU [Salinibacillus xinjiangensis]
MDVTKAIIPAAGLGTRFLPATKAQPKEMLPIVDKPTIQYIVEEAVQSGIKDIMIISGRGKRAIEDHFDKSYELEENLSYKGKTELLEQVRDISNLANIHYIRQKEPLGLGHAILCAKSFIGNEPFGVLLGDDIMFNSNNTPPLKQLMDSYQQAMSPIVGVKEVAESDTSKYGIVDIKSSSSFNGSELMRLNGLVEKPNPEDAPSRYAIMGRYILTPEIFSLLENQKPGAGNEIQLTDALHEFNKTSDIYGLHMQGDRFDVGNKFGFIEATIEVALKRNDLKDDVLELLRDKVREYE